MSNKPVENPEYHDASDQRCVHHNNAKKHAGVKADLTRTCPACVQVDG